MEFRKKLKHFLARRRSYPDEEDYIDTFFKKQAMEFDRVVQPALPSQFFQQINKPSGSTNHQVQQINKPFKNDLELIGSSFSDDPQRKFALMAQAAYFEANQTNVDKFIKDNKSLYGFKLDTELSSQKNSVFFNPNTGETVISFKGTNPKNAEDLWDDLAILGGFETQTSRFKGADKLYNTVEQKYGKDRLKIVGHSLGGSAAMFVGEKHDVETHSYNPGISYRASFQMHMNNKNASFVYTTTGDPVSILRDVNIDPHRTFISVHQTNLLDSHSINNFIDEHNSKTIEDIAGFWGGYKKQLKEPIETPGEIIILHTDR